ncbi:hypothetical protein CTI12_AA052090 [Artemisia annua]|uniref:Uncharacterized protein n=1 Tax=Artemisia annua TaxID=35608 RepID=A0A2U1QB77_ARTAN|nr:hypothetical protein CTI12_AA052090 [Artemisia annua]
MAASALLLVALKTVFSILACVMVAAFAYGLVMDGFHSCLDPHARWMQVAIIDFCVNISAIGAWFFYKESRWIIRVVFCFILFWFGSALVCGYIALLLFKLSPEESLKDPIYFVLAKRRKRDEVGHTRGHSVITVRVIFAALGCLMVGAVIYALIGDGFPFQARIFTPCMIATTTDNYIHVVVFSVWIAYKESSCLNTFLWIILSVCFGSIVLCSYILRELFYLSHDQPIYLILFNKSKRDMHLSNPLLMEHTNV